jgi:hypothetical protein
MAEEGNFCGRHKHPLKFAVFCDVTLCGLLEIFVRNLFCREGRNSELLRKVAKALPPPGNKAILPRHLACSLLILLS